MRSAVAKLSCAAKASVPAALGTQRQALVRAVAECKQSRSDLEKRRNKDRRTFAFSCVMNLMPIGMAAWGVAYDKPAIAAGAVVLQLYVSAQGTDFGAHMRSTRRFQEESERLKLVEESCEALLKALPATEQKDEPDAKP